MQYMKIERDDPLLIQTVEEMGPRANNQGSALTVVMLEIMIDIQDYDGLESLYVTWNERRI